ncbi:lysylphosphatidylglycerol synthase domain-containing protein [Nonomuraea lactucae]|uniref:lysylphosphatidylglycerol synthase domain-containing protein n=1 Tax=Nonomuraea lactucae TaxID=2249762 RepID=UPI001962ED4C|nr:lysylphosphatidylglycerol synthase domain-containing protein [Nonomuraea lactucae]
MPIPPRKRPLTALVRRGIGLIVLVVAVTYLTRIASGEDLVAGLRALLSDPAGVGAALLAYACAFGLRAWSWRLVLPALPIGQAWAALHVSLLGNHVLPFRLGEALRVTSVTRRTDLPAGPVIASTVTLRSADLLSVALLAAVAAPGLLSGPAVAWFWPMVCVLGVVMLAGLIFLVRGTTGDGGRSATVRRASVGRVTVRWAVVMPVALAAAVAAWTLEAAVVYEVARLAGIALSPGEAVAVTAVTIAAQTVAVTPGGFGSYEAAAAAALTALGVAPGPAFAVALITHALKTAYSLAVGGVALALPQPGYFGRFRLPRRLPSRPEPAPADPEAPVVAFIPVFDEEQTIGTVVSRLPSTVGGRKLHVIVVDDGSTDASAARAAQAGATVIPQPRNLGLGAAVRLGLSEAVRLSPAAVVYLDADLEYFPEDIERVAAPILSGRADYVVGSRFAGEIERMLAHRRFGNQVLTRWVRWMTRHEITDGQSGYRAFSPAAARDAEVIHDYNYAQVLTLDLLAKGYVYQEVPIRYAFRATGESFVKLGRYLRMVIPATYRELNSP